MFAIITSGLSNDKRILVGKRVGLGTTINIAHPVCKILVGLYIVCIAAAFIPVFTLIFRLQNTDLDLRITGNEVAIESSMYKYNFKKDEILGVEVIDKMPKYKRTNGLDDGSLLLGNFSVDGYGTSRVYVWTGVKKIVVLKLKDKTIFITGDDENEAEEIYKEVLNNENA